MGGAATTGGWTPSARTRNSIQTNGPASAPAAAPAPPSAPQNIGGPGKGKGGGGGSPTYPDKVNPADSLVDNPQGGMKIEEAAQQTGVLVRGVEWILNRFGASLMEVIKYVSGDYEQIDNNAKAFENIGFACQDIRNNLNEGWLQLEPFWDDDAAGKMKTRIEKDWTIGMEVEAKIAQLIGRGFGIVAKGSKEIARQIIKLIEKGVRKALEAIVAAAIPVVGWARAALIVYDVIDIIFTIYDLYKAIERMITGFKEVIDGIMQIKNAISAMGSGRNLNDAINDTNALGRGVRDTARGARNIASGAQGVRAGTAKLGNKASDVAQNAATTRRENAGDISYGNRDGRMRDESGNPLQAGDRYDRNTGDTYRRGEDGSYYRTSDGRKVDSYNEHNLRDVTPTHYREPNQDERYQRDADARQAQEDRDKNYDRANRATTQAEEKDPNTGESLEDKRQRERRAREMEGR